MFYRVEKEPLVSYESKIKKYLTILPFLKTVENEFHSVLRYKINIEKLFFDLV